MKTWMLSRFAQDVQIGLSPEERCDWPVASSYAHRHWAKHPDTPDGWALVCCDSTTQHLEAAAQDPRVQPYYTVYDPITPETVRAYAAQGATPGMMLCQLLALLARSEPAYAHALNTDFGGFGG